ncbi:MAG: hypothetical protein IKB70_07000 [Bacilli bacterium]|nr:hypothetical protein [Bacilli bacterium]
MSCYKNVLTLKEFLELPFGIKGKIAIWPAGNFKNIGEKYDYIEEFDSVYDSRLDKHLQSKVLQIFPDSDRTLNIVLY